MSQRSVRVRAIFVLATALLMLAAVFSVLAPQTVKAAQTVPYKVNFQGRLADNNGNTLSDGLYNIKFRLWTALSGGSNVWEEDRVITGIDNRVQVTNGLFNIQFGDLTALSPSLFSGAFPLYLEVELPTPATATCATNGCAVFTEGAMTPRQPMASSAYALNADTVDGIDAASLVQLSPAGAQTGNININGTIASTGAINGATISGGSLSATAVNSLNVSANAIAVATAATSLTVTSGTTGALNLATQGSGKTIQIGQTTAAVTDIINVGNSSFTGSVDTVTVGNLLGTSTTAIQGGTGSASAISLTAGTNGGILASTTGTGIIELDSDAGIVAQSTTNNTQAFQIQNSGGVSILNIDTSTGAAANLLSNSGFEKNPMTNWTNLGTATVARDTTQAYVGFASGKVTAGTTAGNGVEQPVTLGLNTQYTLSFYAKLDSASAPLTTLQAGYSSTGLAGGEVDCTLNSITVITAGWSRYICTFTTPGTTSGTPYIYIEHNDTTSEVFYVDSAQLETGSFATPYGQGILSLNATVSSPVNFQENANSTTAFQITNTIGTNILNVDTLNNNLSNQATNPSFETGLTGWAAKTGCTLTQDATGGYNGTSSAKCVNTATASAGMNMTGISPIMVSGTTYTMSMYVKASANMTTLEIGRADNGSTDTPCLTAQTVTSLGWKKFTCTFTAGAQSGTPYIYVKQTDATARTIWVDAVLLETDANASTNYRDGRISLGNATISSPAVFQTNTNSTTAFQIQNAGGIQVFNVDTASDTNLVTNSGFEVNSTGWSLKGSATNLVRDTSKTYVGIASGKVTTTVTSGDGMRYTFASPLPAVAATAYTISAYVETSAADATFTMGYNSGSDTNCTVAPAASATVPATTGWTRFVCSTPVNTAVNSIYITSGTTAVTLNVDGVRVELGATATAFGNSNISFNGVFTSPVTIRNPNDTTTEFQVQNGASTNLLTVDSLNKQVEVGSPTADATQILLQLDTYTAAGGTAADTAACSTTSNQGALYYNGTTNAIRGCVNGSWEDVVTTSGLGVLAFGVIPDSSNAGTAGDIAGVSNYTNSPCKVTWLSTTSVQVNPCMAYSGGRRVIIPTTTVSVAGLAASAYANICLNGTGGQPALGAGNATETSAALPAFSANNPVECLATVRASGTAGNIGFIWDTRTFTNTVKEFATVNSVNNNGFLVVGTATAAVYQTTAVAATAMVRGVVVATSGTASAVTANAIIAVRGPAFVKFVSGGTATVNNLLETTSTAGYGTSVTNVVGTSTLSNYIYGGPLEMSISTSCTTANTAASACQYAPLVDFSPTR